MSWARQRRMDKNMERQWGAFCEVFGIAPKNRILEFFLEMRELDFSIGDIAKETGLNRATAYNTMEELLKKGYIVPTRKVSGGQLYKLNGEREEVKVLIKSFNLILKEVANEYAVERNIKRKVYA